MDTRYYGICVFLYYWNGSLNLNLEMLFVSWNLFLLDRILTCLPFLLINYFLFIIYHSYRWCILDSIELLELYLAFIFFLLSHWNIIVPNLLLLEATDLILVCYYNVTLKYLFSSTSLDNLLLGLAFLSTYYLYCVVVRWVSSQEMSTWLHLLCYATLEEPR